MWTKHFNIYLWERVSLGWEMDQTRRGKHLAAGSHTAGHDAFFSARVIN
jgi:hypothetical protein